MTPITSDEQALAVLSDAADWIESVEEVDVSRDRAAIEYLRTRLAKTGPAVGGWLPIETAPKDGRTLILLLTPSNWPQVAWSNTWWTTGFSVECKPTAWCPLPQPPTAALEARG